ncbi:DUF1800 domain-containing protein [Thalassococcus sp. BH17M4-6]|uniref:DUF1800 domain-containing protein n=1 Tax=Thalassococcus sp. BH17M4-6 TaxID=3413148 RepID=UPI003BEBEFEA
MSFDPQTADIRFGCGLSPVVPPPASAEAMLATLKAPDSVAAKFPVETFETFLNRMKYRLSLTRIRRKNRGTPEAAEARKGIKVLNQKARKAQFVWLGRHLSRRIWTDAPLRERLTFFWADHFTATGKAGVIRRGTSPYVESAIRPMITARFEDLLISTVLHPLMVHYLDQQSSVGPNSPRAQKGGRLKGLNENLARELLELHTLGVGGPYTQTDVRELAELLTGVTLAPETGFKFRKDWAEPGAETVLGKSYGGGQAHVRDVKAALRDLARHPATARHIARKLAVHFTSDTPDEGLVAALEARFLETGGQLTEVYRVLLTHPAAWEVAAPNIKPPFEFVSSALRALAVRPDALDTLDERDMRLHVARPLALMGHIWERPDGPDGLPEEDTAWLTPQGLAARLQWAVAVPQTLRPELPDPREFVRTALGARATPNVHFVAGAAETRWDGIGLVLASPAFQRM